MNTISKRKSQLEESDDAELFGKFVAKKLRSLPEEARRTAEFKIHQVLYEVSTPTPSVPASPALIHTPSMASRGAYGYDYGYSYGSGYGMRQQSTFPTYGQQPLNGNYNDYINAGTSHDGSTSQQLHTRTSTPVASSESAHVAPDQQVYNTGPHAPSPAPASTPVASPESITNE